MSNDDLEPVIGFAGKMFDWHRAEMNFTDNLVEAGFGEFNGISGDTYDCSLEIKGAGDDARLNEAAQKLIFDAGFVRVYVNHKNGWETHYTWEKEFKAVRGWRRRYVVDSTVATTNQIGADEPEYRGYFEISYWPDSWTGDMTKDWISSGYMRIVPDPLENK